MPKTFQTLFSTVCLAISLTGCTDKDTSSLQITAHQEPAKWETTLSAHAIKAHMSFLADDLLEGRDAGSRGETISALYISSQFERLGLKPFGLQGTFIQPVPLRAGTLKPSSVKFVIRDANQRLNFPSTEDIAVDGSLVQTSIDVTAEAIFVGHGITAPELGISDYKNLDVIDKIAVVIGGPPKFLPAAEAAHFGSMVQKRKMAAEEGAIGVIRLWTPENESQYAFDLLQKTYLTPSMTWIGPEDQIKDPTPEIILRATIRGAAAEHLFETAPMSAAEAIAHSDKGSVDGFPLGKPVSLKLSSKHNNSIMSGNVAGFLSGADPQLKDEVVVVTAHYDHMGICGEIDAKDRICNGALDNALGTAAMIDVARQFSASEMRPKRSILFLAVGAEEKGLLGSDYFVSFPTIGDRKIVANINMDGGMPFYEFSDVIAFGAEQSDLGETLASAIEPMNLTVTPDPFPELSIFTRSDQYSFVLKGVPSLFLYHGFSDMNGDNVGRKIWDEMLETSYHQPSDDLLKPIDYAVASKYAEVFYRLTFAVANAPQAPKWYEDSIFGQRFAPNEPKAVRP